MRIKYTREILAPIISQNITWADVCRELGLRPATGSQSHIKSRAIFFGIDFSHFAGQGANRGRTFPKTRIDINSIKKYLIKGSIINSNRLKGYLWRTGLKSRICEDCGIIRWRGKLAPLDLDHINNDHSDNRLKNLKVRCANCHRIKNTGG